MNAESENEAANGPRIAIAQINPTVGDLRGNMDVIKRDHEKARDLGADLVVYSELCVTGYPTEDLVLKPSFQSHVEAAVHELVELTATGGPAMLIGAPWTRGGALHNAALLLQDGAVAAIRSKIELPNYGVFDEMRLFKAADATEPVHFAGVNLGVMICEDMWLPRVAGTLAANGAEMLVVLNSSPFELDKHGYRRGHAHHRVNETGLPLIYVNQIGGQDELVFDGASFVMEADGSIPVQAKSWEEDLVLTDWSPERGRRRCLTQSRAPRAEGMESLYRALCLGLSDYVEKNRFPGVVLGLSGGIDSALSAAVAVDTLGPDRVWAVMMPSPHTGEESLEDARLVAEMLGIRYDTIPIGGAMEAFDQVLSPIFGNRPPDVTEENIQPRARGLILMALSNKFGHMLLTTGNKSEMSVGYATLYGDMCGGYSVLKDVYKTTVFALSRWRNGWPGGPGLALPGPVMPERVITKPPSAELRPDQKDEDSLPPYDILDPILMGLIEKELSVDDLVAEGFDRDTVRRIWVLLDRAEYKRRQAPPGVKVTERAFGRDRRYPITNGFTALI